MGTPHYSDLGNGYYTLPLKPPFLFEQMKTRVFPLRASGAILQRLVDSYANQIPAALGRFRVNMPYVYLLLADYGKLTLAQQDFGWLSQIEVMFAIPVEWYVVDQGRWEFKDWALLTPFICVDSELSLILGRTVYGWPKMFGFVTSTGHDLTERFSLSTLSASPFKNTPEEWLPMLEIQPRSNATQTSGSFVSDWLDLAQKFFLYPPFVGMDLENHLRKISKAMSMSGLPSLPHVTNTINLKQFRNANQPDQACFQSLTLGTMRITALHGGGLLGNNSLWRGDSSGGIGIRIYNRPSLPIVEMLGLEVEQVAQENGVGIFDTRPVIPFWYNVNMMYDRGHDIAWRTFDGPWHSQQGNPILQPNFPRSIGTFNTTLRGSVSSWESEKTQDDREALETQETVTRLLPLQADRKRLQAFFDKYLNAPLNKDTQTPTGLRFEIWSSPDTPTLAHVYMIMINPVHGSGSNAAPYRCMLCVPARKLQFDGTTWNLVGTAFVPAFSYTNRNDTMISDTEIFGLPTLLAQFSLVTTVAEQVQTISIEALSKLHVGERTAILPVIQVIEHSLSPSASSMHSFDLGSLTGPSSIPTSDSVEQITQQLSHTAQNICGDVCLVTLKQFRDVFDTARACYQSIVELPFCLRRVREIKRLSSSVNVRLYHHESHLLVETLGLQARAEQVGETVRYSIEPVQPIEMVTQWQQGKGIESWYRANTDRWQKVPRAVTEPNTDLNSELSLRFRDPQELLEYILQPNTACST